jgi:hypothetical protein
MLLIAMARSVTGAAETEASHEVMELVRGIPALSLLVIRLRESGLSWRDVKTAIDAERTKNAINHRRAANGARRKIGSMTNPMNKSLPVHTTPAITWMQFGSQRSSDRDGDGKHR